MKQDTAAKIREEIKQHAKFLPLGYQFLKEPVIATGVRVTCKSSFHQTMQFGVGYYHKPISLIMI